MELLAFCGMSVWRCWVRGVLFGWIVLLAESGAEAASLRDRYFETSDGVRLHYWEGGQGPETLVFVPGWLMPAAVFEPQIRGLSDRYRVVVFDPRSQGKSEVGKGAHTPERRSRDLHELLEVLRAKRPILAGWSLGVMEVLDYLAKYQPKEVAGLVLIDNSIGEGRPPAPSKSSSSSPSAATQSREEYLREFTRSLTAKPMSAGMFDAIFSSARQVPADIAKQLLNKPFPREYWRDTLLAQRVPIFYAVRPRFEEQGRLLVGKRPGQASMEVFREAGHALFLDEPQRFNELVERFADRVWGANLRAR
jgi:non-heme chloroperoxidase